MVTAWYEEPSASFSSKTDGIVGRATADGEEAIAEGRELRPDLVVLDLREAVDQRPRGSPHFARCHA